MAPIETILSHLLFSLLIGVPLLRPGGGGRRLIFWWAARWRPWCKLRGAPNDITLHNLNERLPLTNTGDELEHLSLALNRMIARLSEAFEQNRRFLADASHELRTPLAALRGEMESVVEQTRALAGIARPGGERFGGGGSSGENCGRPVCDFPSGRGGVAARVGHDLIWPRWPPARPSKCLCWRKTRGLPSPATRQGKVSVDGDRARIKQVVVNLLDNAIKYTPPGGTINLNVHARGGKAVLEVADTGIGIPASALPHIFERFFRVDKARSREAGGAGLGLAIVKSICAAHGGKVEVESVEGKGSRFRVELPLATPVTK